MFWNRKKYQDDKFGELKFYAGYWSPNLYRNGDKFYVFIEGSKARPNSTSLELAKSIMNSIDRYEAIAIEYIESNGIRDEICTSDPLILESISPSTDSGKFDLCFGVENDDDWAVTIHFEKWLAYEVSLVH